jgi:hypothetical protein|tara:strand:- start:443 stop:661 length:219 start_codon:yes stop_codon:yes gene_type:complete
MKNKKGSVIRKVIKINKHTFNLEIYPALVDWEIFPHNYNAALYAFSNKDKLKKEIETNHVYEQRKQNENTNV